MGVVAKLGDVQSKLKEVCAWCESTSKQQTALAEQLHEISTKVADPADSEANLLTLEQLYGLGRFDRPNA